MSTKVGKTNFTPTPQHTEGSPAREKSEPYLDSETGDNPCYQAINHPEKLQAKTVIVLQRLCGNQAVNRLLAKPGLKPKVMENSARDDKIVSPSSETARQQSLEAEKEEPLRARFATLQRQSKPGMVQRKLKLTGPAYRVSRVLKIINGALLIKKTNVQPDGYIALVDTGHQGPATKVQADLTKHLETIIGDSKDTEISVGDHEKDVLVGSYDAQKIDIADIEAFGKGEGVSSLSSLMHEIVEQYRKQVQGEAYDIAHFTGGVPAEEEMSGAVRGDHKVEKSVTNPDGSTELEVSIPYTYPNGKVVSVKLTIIDGNIKKVERTIIKQPIKTK